MLGKNLENIGKAASEIYFRLWIPIPAPFSVSVFFLNTDPAKELYIKFVSNGH